MLTRITETGLESHAEASTSKYGSAAQFPTFATDEFTASSAPRAAPPFSAGWRSMPVVKTMGALAGFRSSRQAAALRAEVQDVLATMLAQDTADNALVEGLGAILQ